MHTQLKKDFLFRGKLSDLDPEVAELARHETARQALKLIMIPSESTIPEAVRETLSTAFHNIYAEGYPLSSNRHMEQQDILDYPARLAEFRRDADERYYKGTEYANATFKTIQNKVIKTAAWVKEMKTKIKVEFPKSCTTKELQVKAFEMLRLLRV